MPWGKSTIFEEANHNLIKKVANTNIIIGSTSRCIEIDSYLCSDVLRNRISEEASTQVMKLWNILYIVFFMDENEVWHENKSRDYHKLV